MFVQHNLTKTTAVVPTLNQNDHSKFCAVFVDPRHDTFPECYASFDVLPVLDQVLPVAR
jgi:hypothetical protein